MRKEITYVFLSCFFFGGGIFGIISLYVLVPEGFNLSEFVSEPKFIKVLSIGTLLCGIIGALLFFKSTRVEK